MPLHLVRHAVPSQALPQHFGGKVVSFVLGLLALGHASVLARLVVLQNELLPRKIVVRIEFREYSCLNFVVVHLTSALPGVDQ